MLYLIFNALLVIVFFCIIGVSFGINAGLMCSLILILLLYFFQNALKNAIKYPKNLASKILKLPFKIINLCCRKFTLLINNKILLRDIPSKLKRKIDGNKPQYFKKFFCHKPFYIFLAFFVLGNVVLCRVTYNSQKSLALNEKVYGTNVDISNITSGDLLSDKFNSEPYSSTQGYLIYAFLFLGLMLGAELFILGSTIAYKKHSPKLYLLFYLIVLQILAISPVFVVALAPEHVISSLNRRAGADVAKQIALLSSNDGLKQLSIISSPVEIKNSISQSSTPPKIIDEQADSQAIIQSLQIQEKDTFYRVVILPRYLLTQEGLTITFDAYLFPNNVLVIKKATRDLLSNIIPVLSLKIVDSEMGKALTNKKEPIFSILSDDAYNLVLTQKVEERKTKFINYINDLKSSIADANYYIPRDQANIKSLEQEKIDYKNRTDGVLKDCESLYPIEDCKRWRDIVSKNIASYDDDLKTISEDLQTWLYLKPRLTSNLQQVTISYEKFLKFPITPELQAGVFNIPDHIYLKYYSEGDLIPSPSDYVHVGLHEYLHYEAYKQSFYLPSFIDEGITDYLASRLINKYSFNQEIIFHYPDEVSIIQELTKNIPEDKLISVYFSQSEKEFEKLFDSYYSKGTYKELVTMGEDLTYLDAFDREGRERARAEIVQFLISNKKDKSNNGKN